MMTVSMLGEGCRLFDDSDENCNDDIDDSDDHDDGDCDFNNPIFSLLAHNDIQ